jgi:hypothetical protein
MSTPHLEVPEHLRPLLKAAHEHPGTRQLVDLMTSKVEKAIIDSCDLGMSDLPTQAIVSSVILESMMNIIAATLATGSTRERAAATARAFGEKLAMELERAPDKTFAGPEIHPEVKDFI